MNRVVIIICAFRMSQEDSDLKPAYSTERTDDWPCRYHFSIPNQIINRSPFYRRLGLVIANDGDIIGCPHNADCGYSTYLDIDKFALGGDLIRTPCLHLIQWQWTYQKTSAKVKCEGSGNPNK